jgi:hypothetical protein
MPLAIQSAVITGNGSATFTFGDTIGAYVYGLQEVNLQSQSSGEIQRIGVMLRPQDSAVVGTDTLTIDQQLQMDDVDLTKSWTEVVVVAWIGSSNPPGLVMQNQNGVPVGQTSQALPLEYPPLYAVAAVAGFAYSFDSDDSDFLGIGVGAGATQSVFSQMPSVAAVAAGTWTGDSGFTGTVDMALLAVTDGAPSGIGLAYLPVGTLNTSQGVEVPATPGLGGGAVGAAAFLLQSFYAQFDIRNDPTPDLSLLRMGVDGGSIVLNGAGQGTVNATSNQSFVGQVPGQYGPITVDPTNMIVNYTVVETT